MFYIRTVKGQDKQIARGEELFLNGTMYRTNEVGALQCVKPAGEYEIMVGGKIRKCNVQEGETLILRTDE